MISGSLIIQFTRFLGAGVVATAAHYAVLISLVQLCNRDPILASVLGFGTGALANYLVNYHYTFNSAQSHGQTLPRFLVVATIGAALNTITMTVQIKALGFDYLISQLIASVFVIMWNFTGNRLWTFDQNKS